MQIFPLKQDQPENPYGDGRIGQVKNRPEKNKPAIGFKDKMRYPGGNIALLKDDEGKIKHIHYFSV